MKKAGIIGISAIVLLVAVGAYAMKENRVSGTWRYKMTVTVETPEGIKTGSAVREVSNSASRAKMIEIPHVGNPAEVKGEAVVVDLGSRGKLFALMSGYKWGPDHADSILYEVFPTDKGGTTPDGIEFYKNLKAEPKALTLEQYPRLMAFKDINDPKSAMPALEVAVSDDRPQIYTVKVDHFPELFGEGVRLKEITIEMTDEPVTWGVNKVLPWVYNFYDQKLDGLRFQTIKSEYPFANSLSSGAFSTGKTKNDN